MNDAASRLGGCVSVTCEGDVRLLRSSVFCAMYNLVGCCVGEFGRSFLTGCTNSKFNWLSDTCRGTLVWLGAFSGVMRWSCDRECNDVSRPLDRLSFSFCTDPEEGTRFWKYSWRFVNSGGTFRTFCTSGELVSS